MQIDCAPCVPIEAGIEDARWVYDRSALLESEFYVSLVGLACTDDSTVGPDWNSSPLPFFRYLGVCLLDQLTDVRQRLATPVA